MDQPTAGASHHRQKLLVDLVEPRLTGPPETTIPAQKPLAKLHHGLAVEGEFQVDEIRVTEARFDEGAVDLFQHLFHGLPPNRLAVHLPRAEGAAEGTTAGGFEEKKSIAEQLVVITLDAQQVERGHGQASEVDGVRPLSNELLVAHAGQPRPCGVVVFGDAGDGRFGFAEQ